MQLKLSWCKWCLVIVGDNLLAAVCYNHQRISKAAKAFVASFVFSNTIGFYLLQGRFADFS